MDTIAEMLRYFQKKTYNYCKNTGQIISNDTNISSNNEFIKKSVEAEKICKKFEAVSEDKLPNIGDDISLVVPHLLIKVCV